jgi:hypothetical protein
MFRKVVIALALATVALTSATAGGTPGHVVKVSGAVIGGECIYCTANSTSAPCTQPLCGMWHDCIGPGGLHNCVTKSYCDIGDICGDHTRQRATDCVRE